MNGLHGKKFSLFLSVASAALAVAPILYMANIGGQLAEYPAEYIPSIICAVLSIAAQIAGIVSAGKSFSSIFHILAAVLLGAAFTFYLLGGILSLVDFFCGIVMFGDPQQAPAIIGFGVIMLVAVISAICVCFLKKGEKAAAKA